MLTSTLGIRLVLLIGKTIPTPAPHSAMTALHHVRIINDIDNHDGFQMTFSLGKDKDRGLDYGLLAGGTLDPDIRVVMGVLIGTTLEPLIDGVITHHQVTPGMEPGTATLTVSGRDISVLLDLDERKRPFKNQPASGIVEKVLLDYLKHGVVADITPTFDVPSESERVRQQRQTDLQYVQGLAKENSFVFYIEPKTLGTSIAYWGPENREDLPQPYLTTNMGPSSNSSIRFSLDAHAPVTAKGYVLDPVSKKSSRIPESKCLRKPIAANILPARRTILMRCTSRLGRAQAQEAANSAATAAPESVEASGELDTIRYGGVLRAWRLVGVRGAGSAYDGKYQVRRVTHDIRPGKYTQEFKLSRDGTDS